MTQRRIMVTGGTGYVGTALVPLLASRGVPVTVYCSMAFGNAIAGLAGVEFVMADIRDGNALRFAMTGVTDVVHLAGVVTDELVDMNPALAAQVNEDGTRALCREARRAGVERLVYASSSSVYGSQDAVCTEDTPPQPQTAYARMKLAGERIVNEEAGPMTVCSVRSATCCGPAPRFRADTIINTFSCQAYFHNRITVFDGTQFRSNIHVADIASLYAWLLKRPHEAIHKRTFNAVASWNRADDLASIVASTAKIAIGKEIAIDIDATKHDDRHYRMEGPRLSTAGWTPSRTIIDAVRDNMAWFQEGRIMNWKDDLWHNTKRMAETMKRG